MISNNKTYLEFLDSIKKQITVSRNNAVLSANRELIILYWKIGKSILEKQQSEGWGVKIISSLSTDLKKSFPNLKGFSTRNLKYMRKFADSYPDLKFVQQVVAQIPWGHNIRLLESIDNPEERTWYIHKTIEHGWSRNVLLNQIDSRLFYRQGKSVTNFNKTLPKIQSDLARQTFKDPYIFDFLGIGEKSREIDLERALTKHITRFLLELGAGFAFIGNQYPVRVSGEEYFIDLLFYHLKLRAYIVIELKTGKFKPEYAGKINFYLSVLDDTIKDKKDNSSIGIIICKNKNKVIAEYALRDMSKPIGISEYKLVETIPDEYKSSLPTIEELEHGLKDF